MLIEKKSQTLQKHTKVKVSLSYSPRITTVNNLYNPPIICYILYCSLLYWFSKQLPSSFCVSICTVTSIFFNSFRVLYTIQVPQFV